MYSIDHFTNRVLLGDSLEIMRLLPPSSVDMVMCDLPYGTTHNAWDSVISLPDLWREYRRVVKPSGAIVLTSQGVFTAKLILSAEDLFKYKAVWIKNTATNFLNARRQPLRKHEDILIFYKTQPYYCPQLVEGEPYVRSKGSYRAAGNYRGFNGVDQTNSGHRHPTDVLNFTTVRGLHPTQKPVELGAYFIKTFSRVGDIVLDNTCGSGSFLVAAAQEGRKFIGIEQIEEYALIATKRTELIINNTY